MRTENPPMHYFRAGRIERRAYGNPGGGAPYRWCEGYSLIFATGAGPSQPWLTYREAQAEAKRYGARAVFHETEAEAREAVRRSGR